MNSELREAISNTGNQVTRLTGGFWYLAASQDNPLPYAVFSVVSSSTERDTVDEFKFEYLQINIYHTDLEDLETINQEFIDKFHRQKQNFEMLNYWLIDIDLQFDRPQKLEDKFMFTQQYKNSYSE